jgi:hypothetical protein
MTIGKIMKVFCFHNYSIIYFYQFILVWILLIIVLLFFFFKIINFIILVFLSFNYVCIEKNIWSYLPTRNKTWTKTVTTV